jgi:hypothetical protein
MTAPGTEPPLNDHSLQVAKIDRSKALWVAVITGIFAVVAAGTTGYFAGKKDGTAAAPAASTVVSVSTKTIPAPAGQSGTSAGPATNVADGDAVSLLDLPALKVGGTDLFTVGHPYVDGVRQEKALFTNDPCYAAAGYDLDGKHGMLRATVAVADSTGANVRVVLKVSLDGTAQQSPITVFKGHPTDIAVDVHGGKRLDLVVSSSGVCLGDDQLVLINPVLGN